MIPERSLPRQEVTASVWCTWRYERFPDLGGALANPALLLPGLAKEAALLTSFAGRIYDHAPQQNAVPLG